MSRQPLLGIGKAAWQLEDALSDRLVKKYPDDPEARLTYFKLAQAEGLFRKALLAMIVLSVVETPTWCDDQGSNSGFVEPGSFFKMQFPTDVCTLPGVDQHNLLLSGVLYIPPGVGVVIEFCIMALILRKLLLEWRLQKDFFDPLRDEKDRPVKYIKMQVVYFGLVMVAIELVDCIVFCAWRPRFRFAFIPRTGYLYLLPGVQALFTCISAVIGEFVSIAMFLVGTIIFFAWVVVTIFQPLKGEDGKLDYGKPSLFDGKPVGEGFTTFSEALNTMFVAGSSEEFTDCFMRAYTEYRWSGMLWLAFLVLVKMLLLSLVLDTLVSAYISHSEEVEKEESAEKVEGIVDSFNALLKAGGEKDEISKETFAEFIKEYGRSPRTRSWSAEVVDIMFAAVDKGHASCMDQGEFCAVCGVMQYEFWVTPKDSFVKKKFPKFWDGKFRWLREKVDPPPVEPSTKSEEEILEKEPLSVYLAKLLIVKDFDGFMNLILLANLILVVAETTFDLEEPPDTETWHGWALPAIFSNLEFIFAFFYVGEVSLRLCVFSWSQYWSYKANQFDFFTTWALLGSSVLQAVINYYGGSTQLKKYVNILRLLRLLRVVKQLKRIEAVQFMVGTVSKLVTASKDVLILLFVVTFFFTTLSVQLWGGVLYYDNELTKESEYQEGKLMVFNFHDFLQAFGVWVVMLLVEYKPQFTDAIADATKEHPSLTMKYSWMIFPIFYVCGVSIVFELVKAFTIEVFMDLNKKRDQEEEENEELEDLREKLAEQGDCLHWRVVGDIRNLEKLENLKEQVKEFKHGENLEHGDGHE